MDEDNLTKEWVSKKLDGENQFMIVNQLIQLARQKVRRGEEDEFSLEPKNIALEVIHDIAMGIKGYNDIEEVEEEIDVNNIDLEE